MRILTEPENALCRQYQALMETESVKLEFTPEGVQEIAEIAAQANERWHPFRASFAGVRMLK